MKALPYIRSLAIPASRVYLSDGMPTEAFNAFLRKLAHAAGGFTIVSTEGGWVMQDGTLCVEKVHRVEVLCDDAAVGTVGTLMKRFADYLLTEGEEAVLFVAGDVGFLLTAEDRPNLVQGLIS